VPFDSCRPGHGSPPVCRIMSRVQLCQAAHLLDVCAFVLDPHKLADCCRARAFENLVARRPSQKSIAEGGHNMTSSTRQGHHGVVRQQLPKHSARAKPAWSFALVARRRWPARSLGLGCHSVRALLTAVAHAL